MYNHSNIYDYVFTLCVCVCACVRACMRACKYSCEIHVQRPVICSFTMTIHDIGLLGRLLGRHIK